MTIPTSFQIGGRTWRVVYVDSISDDDSSTVGLCSPTSSTITIARTVEGQPVDEQQQLQTFVHEFVHACLATTGYHDLYLSEPFVTAMELMVMEYLRTRA